MSAIYIHIPFCRQACSYCDFYFVTRKQLLPDFVTRICRNIRSYADSIYAAEPVETLYVGGGTPSQLQEKHIEAILNALSDTFTLRLKEFTFEINPDDVSSNYLATLKQLGVTRPSMGIQSFNPKLLAFMHRAHSSNEAEEALDMLKKAEFPTYSVDLIYGNPSQSLDELEEDISKFLQCDPPHISAYSLTIEPNTRLGRQKKMGRLQPLDEDAASRHYDYVVERLNRAGIHQYEISNFAKEGHRANHNCRYWHHKNYLGFGPASHSFWWDRSTTTAKRWNIKPDIRNYLADASHIPLENTEYLEPHQLAEERIMLGLRTTGGLSISTLKKQYKYTFNAGQWKYIKNLCAKGFMQLEDGKLRLTHKGLRIADTITVDILSK